jgi:hypothetical protein
MLVALEIYAGIHEPSEGIDHDEMPGSPSITFQFNRVPMFEFYDRLREATSEGCGVSKFSDDKMT